MSRLACSLFAIFIGESSSNVPLPRMTPSLFRYFLRRSSDFSVLRANESASRFSKVGRSFSRRCCTIPKDKYKGANNVFLFLELSNVTQFCELVAQRCQTSTLDNSWISKDLEKILFQVSKKYHKIAWVSLRETREISTSGKCYLR